MNYLLITGNLLKVYSDLEHVRFPQLSQIWCVYFVYIYSDLNIGLKT